MRTQWLTINKIIKVSFFCLGILFILCSCTESPELAKPVQSNWGDQSDEQKIQSPSAKKIEHNMPAPSPPSNQEEDPLVDSNYNPFSEKYYDYFRTHPQVVTLFNDGYFEETPEGFDDSQMAAFTLLTLARQYNYNYEIGFSPEIFRETANKYFPQGIHNFNNQMTRVIEETGYITATGWSFNGSPFLVLKEILPGSGDVVSARFYYWYISDTYEWPEKITPDGIKRSFLTGDTIHLPSPSLVDIHFEEREDEGGTYLMFYSTKIVENNYEGIVVPYNAN